MFEQAKQLVGLNGKPHPDSYALIQESPQRNKIKSYDSPVEPEYVRLNENLEAGTYRLQEVNNGQFGEVVWSDITIEHDPVEKAKQEAQQAKREARNASQNSQQVTVEQTFEDPSERLSYHIVEAATESPEIMSQKGDKIVDQALDRILGSDDPEVNYEIDGPLEAALHDIRRNPELAQEHLKLVGDIANRLGNAAMTGALSQVSDRSDQTHSARQQNPDGTDEDKSEAESEVPPPTRGNGGGPTDMNDLALNVDSTKIKTVEDSPDGEDSEAGNQEPNSIENDNEDRSPDPADAGPIGEVGDESGSKSERPTGEKETGTGLNSKSYDQIAKEIAEEMEG